MNNISSVEALPKEQYLEQMMQNEPSYIERTIFKYFKYCRQGMQRIEDYEEYLANQIMYHYYRLIEDLMVEKLTQKECIEIIDDIMGMIQHDRYFLKKNQYCLKSFPINEEMIRNYYDSEYYFNRIFIPNLLKRIEKKERDETNENRYFKY